MSFLLASPPKPPTVDETATKAKRDINMMTSKLRRLGERIGGEVAVLERKFEGCLATNNKQDGMRYAAEISSKRRLLAQISREQTIASQALDRMMAAKIAHDSAAINMISAVAMRRLNYVVTPAGASSAAEMLANEVGRADETTARTDEASDALLEKLTGNIDRDELSDETWDQYLAMHASKTAAAVPVAGDPEESEFDKATQAIFEALKKRREEEAQSLKQ
jgi:hypothetical protein